MFAIVSFWGEINAIASLDVGGDGNYEIFLGTEKGLYLVEDLNAKPKKVVGVDAPVLHISYYDSKNLLLTLDDILTPIVLMSHDAREFKSLKVTGRYHKAFKLGKRVYLLAEDGLFVLDKDSLYLVLDGARDATVCGVGGRRRLFASSDDITLVVGITGTDTLDLGSSFVVCGDTAVYTEFGSIVIKNGKPQVNFADPSSEPHTEFDGLNLQMKGGLISVNGALEGESRAVALYPYRGELYLVYGSNYLRFIPLNIPFIRSYSPFMVRFKGNEVIVSDFNLMNSMSFGILPVSSGKYSIEVGGKKLELQVDETGEYDITNYLSSDSPIKLLYTVSGLEIYVDLQHPSYVEVNIVSFTGEVLNRLFSGFKSGDFKLVWDGDIKGGKVARKGVYLVQVKIGDKVYSRRFVWLK